VAPGHTSACWRWEDVREAGTFGEVA
jgi:hypothetical protein